MSEKKNQRKGVWEQIEMIEDPDSHIGLLLSERVRGRHGYSMQIVHIDEIGPNKHVPMAPKGAKHDLKDIVYSLVARAQEMVEEREAKLSKKSG